MSKVTDIMAHGIHPVGAPYGQRLATKMFEPCTQTLKTSKRGSPTTMDNLAPLEDKDALAYESKPLGPLLNEPEPEPRPKSRRKQSNPQRFVATVKARRFPKVAKHLLHKRGRHLRNNKLTSTMNN